MSAANVSLTPETRELVEIWRSRAIEHGARCVLNLNHPVERYGEITRQQTSILFPLLSRTLSCPARRALDYGCGPGRFTPALAELLSARCKGESEVVGFDVCGELLTLAPTAPGVTYMSSAKELDSIPTGYFDLGWVCLVLGGLGDESLREAAYYLTRSLTPNGRLFLVEHIARQSIDGFWRFRTFDEYKRIFPEFRLRQIGRYFDFGQPVWVISGVRKPIKSGGVRSWMRYTAAALRQTYAAVHFVVQSYYRQDSAVG